MRLIGIAVALTLNLTFAPLVGDAQPAGKVSRVGVLSSGSVALDDAGNGRQAFRERLSDLGWVVGQKELVQLKVGMIEAFGTPAALAATRATVTIPIVIVAGDPADTGLVANLAHPGGNITGLTNEAGLEIFAKRLELLKETAPKISRLGILTNRSNAAEAVLIRERVDALTATENPLNVEPKDLS
jgi:putative ABC transport system substrate-binding protein